MKLRATDQISVSSVRPDSLRPGEEFEISDVAGAELLAAHPDKIERLDVPPAKTGGKAKATPRNQAKKAPANKANR